MDCDLKTMEKDKYKEHLEQKYNSIKDNRYIMEDVIIPIANALKLPLEEVIDIFINKYDGVGLYETHAYGEQARMGCLGRKVDIDLGLCWVCDFFGLISKKDADLIRKKVVEDTLMKKIPYKIALENGRKIVVELLK